MLKSRLIKDIGLSSWLFHSLSLRPEASGLTSMYLLAMTKMSIITILPLFFHLPCLWVFSSMYFTLNSVLLKCTGFSRISHVLATTTHILVNFLHWKKHHNEGSKTLWYMKNRSLTTPLGFITYKLLYRTYI